MEKSAKSSFNYHQIPSLSVLLCYGEERTGLYASHAFVCLFCKHYILSFFSSSCIGVMGCLQLVTGFLWTFHHLLDILKPVCHCISMDQIFILPLPYCPGINTMTQYTQNRWVFLSWYKYNDPIHPKQMSFFVLVLIQWPDTPKTDEFFCPGYKYNCPGINTMTQYTQNRWVFLSWY